MNNLSKGQAAVEYLTTYGWMLLVVAVVGGALYGFFQGQCLNSSSGFSGSDIRVEDFGVDANGQMQVELRNANPENINVTQLTVYNPDTGDTVSSPGPIVPAAGTEITTVGPATTFTTTQGCNTLTLQVTYDGGAADNLQVTGSITGGFTF